MHPNSVMFPGHDKMTAPLRPGRQSDAFIPNPVSNGPWDPNSMHGRVVIGLLAHVNEERHGSDEFVPARLTVDMFRLPNIPDAGGESPRDLSAMECGSRWWKPSSSPRQHQHGARLMPVVASDGKCARQRLVAIRTGTRPLPDTMPPLTEPRPGMNGTWRRG